MDSGLLNGVVLLDLRKAFDTANHEILIKKLYLSGIKEQPFSRTITKSSTNVAVLNKRSSKVCHITSPQMQYKDKQHS